DAWHVDGYCCASTWQAGACASCGDGDGDGYDDALCGGDDCNDSVSAVHPGAAETCGDGVDQDCSGLDLTCAADTTAPVLSSGLPVGTLAGGTTQATLRVTTNEAATCKWSASAGTTYAAMATTFTTTGTTSHNTVVTGLADSTSYTYYVRCQDGASNATTSDYVVSFSVGTGTGPLTVSLVPSRTSGVAPLHVFFDASGTTDASVTSRPFHDLDYRWAFGDAAGSPVSGTTWATGSGAGVNSRNSAMGPVAAHVFEVPGTYTVALSVFDGVNTDSAETTITVSDPEVLFAGTNTMCFSTSGSFAGCPAGATQVTTASFNTAINNNVAPNRRLLFRRGETFTAASPGTVDVNGPGIIGAYGTGAKPIVNGPGTAPVISLGTYGSGMFTDWRFMDLYLDGQDNQAGENVGIGTVGQFDQVTILRVDVVGTSTGFAASHWTLTSGQQGYDQWSIQDSTAAGVPRCNWDGHYICNWRIYVVGTRWSMQGNTLDNLGEPLTPELYAGGSHVIRAEMLQNSVIGNNTLKGAGNFQLDIKLHAWAWDGSAGGNATAGTYTENIVIADNKIEGGANPWMLSLGPQDEITDERVRDIIVERNWFTSNSRTQLHMHLNSSATTIRNNLCDLTGAAYHTCVSVSRWGVTPAPADVHVFNNTFYSGSPGDFVGVEIGTASDTIVQNNLASAPNASG
ncbi:MAG: MopE-related protein, partial [Myxococcota bacterium]